MLRISCTRPQWVFWSFALMLGCKEATIWQTLRDWTKIELQDVGIFALYLRNLCSSWRAETLASKLPFSWEKEEKQTTFTMIYHNMPMWRSKSILHISMFLHLMFFWGKQWIYHDINQFITWGLMPSGRASIAVTAWSTRAPSCRYRWPEQTWREHERTWVFKWLCQCIKYQVSKKDAHNLCYTLVYCR